MIGRGPLENAMRLQSLRASGARTSSRIGFVTSYDPTNYAVKATLQPDDVETGWLSFASFWVGNGWGLFAPPSINQRISVELIDGDLDAGFAELSLFDNDNRPLEVQSGEFWLVHKLGAYFKLLNTGAVTFSDSKGASLTMNGDGTVTSAASTWNHTGDVNVTGKVTATSDITSSGGNVSDKTDSMQTMRNQHNEHAHTGVQTGGGTSGTPTVTM